MWLALRSSLWFVPTLLVLAAVALALGLVEIEPRMRLDLSTRYPRLFGAGAEGARGMLSAIATSMITVAGVVFSVTIVALAQASSQYSPRVLRHFMADRPTQIVLGAFVAVFAYCLIVLRTIRGGAEGAFVPSLAVLGGVVMAFVGIALLIGFIHHVASAIQVSAIVARIAEETEAAIDRLFPAEVGEEVRSADQTPAGLALAPVAESVAADASGYVVALDADRLLALAEQADAVLQVVPGVGDFVAEGSVLVHVRTAASGVRVDVRTLLRTVSLGPERDIGQDADHGLQQLVDIGLRALSPGVHDPTTAIACIDRLGALLLRLTNRRIEGPLRSLGGRLRLIVEGRSYAELVETALGALTHQAGSHAAVNERLVGVVQRLLGLARDPVRRGALLRRLRAHRARIPEQGLAHADAEALIARIDALLGPAGASLAAPLLHPAPEGRPRARPGGDGGGVWT